MLTLTLLTSYLWLYLFLFVKGFIKPYDDGCHWLYDIVDSQTMAKEPNLNPIKSFINTTGYLNESIKVDFLNDRHKVQGENFEAFPYFLKINIRCPGREDESEIINMGLASSHPRVVMRLTHYDPGTLCVARRLMMDLEGVLVHISDPIQLKGQVVDVSQVLGPDVDAPDRFSLKKDVEYPYSIWLVPIPLAETIYSIDVVIHSPHIGKQRRQEHFMLYYDYFKTTIDPNPIGHFNLTALAPSVAFPSSLLASKSNRLNTANAFPLPLIFDNFAWDSIIYTPDEGQSFYRYQFTAPQGTNSPCGDSDFKILSHAVLPHRILLGTTYGLVQILSILGSKKYPATPIQSVILNKCVNTIVLPQINNLHGAYLTLITDTEILQSPYFAVDGVFLFNTITKVVDACTAIKNLRKIFSENLVGNCIFTDAFEVQSTNATFSVKLISDLSETEQICLFTYALRANTTTYQWIFRSCLPQYLPKPDLTMPYTIVLPENSSEFLESLQSQAPIVPSKITGIKHRDTGSLEYYAYGAGLFYSNDGGYSWIYFHKFAKTEDFSDRTITGFDCSMAGTRYVALTVSATKTDSSQLNEIWVGFWGKPMFYNLYPTDEWELSLLLLPDNSEAFNEWKTPGSTPGQRVELGVFFDSIGNLKKTFAYKNSSTKIWTFKSLKFPVDELIPAVYSSKIDFFTDSATAKLEFGSNDCPEIVAKIRNRQETERLEYFRFLKPQTRQEDYYQFPEVATVYSTILRSLTNFAAKDFISNYTSTPSGYSEQVTEYFRKSPYPSKWQFEKIVSRSDSRRIMILQEDFQDLVLDDRNVILSDFPDHIYVDRFGNFTIIVSLFDVTATDFDKNDIRGLPKVNFHLVNGSLLQGSMVISYRPEDRIAEYEITFTESGTLSQHLPGRPLTTDTVSIIVPQSIDCFPIKSVYETTVHVGCRPSMQLQFDWQLLVNQSARSFFDCTDPETNMPCLDHSMSVNVFLRMVDHAANMGSNFTGKFRFYVVGFSVGSPSAITRFTDDVIPLYNKVFDDNSNSGMLIWIPATETDANVTDTEARTLDITRNTIQFICQAHSPCGDLKIGIFDEPHLNFLIRVTNKDLPDNGTYCWFDLEFVIRIRGANPNPYTVSIPVFLGTLLALFVLSFCYVKMFFWRKKLEKENEFHLKKEAESTGSGIAGRESLIPRKNLLSHTIGKPNFVSK